MKDYLKFYAIANPAVELFKHALMDAFEKGYELGYADGGDDRHEEHETIHPNCSGCKHFDNEKCTNENFTSSDLTRCHYEPRMSEEAQAILDKVKACENRIIDTHYCESHSCGGCDLNVSDKQIDEARSVLNESAD